MSSRPQLTQERLRRLLFYDPETGVFTWRIGRGRQSAGGIAGCPFSKREGGPRYLAIGVDGRLYQNAGRLAWLYMIGDFPKGQVDHKNRNSLDNRWSNLRLATHGQNQANRGPQKNNTSGLKGVIYIASRKRWRAQIAFGGRTKCIGYAQSKEDAYALYLRAAAIHHDDFSGVAS